MTRRNSVWDVSIKKKLWYVFYLLVPAKLPESRRFLLGKKMRVMCCRNICESVAKNANIEKNAKFNPQCTIGDYSSIGVNCELDGPVSIGKYVMMGPEVVIYTRNHRFSDTDKPMIEQGFDEYRKVIIENDVWIGRRAIIMPGVTIAKGCIIGAGAVVTRSTEAYGIYGGVPAKKIGERN